MNDNPADANSELRELVVSTLWKKNYSELLKSERPVVDKLVESFHQQLEAKVAEALESLIAKEENMGIGIAVIRVSDVRDALAALTNKSKQEQHV